MTIYVCTRQAQDIQDFTIKMKRNISPFLFVYPKRIRNMMNFLFSTIKRKSARRKAKHLVMSDSIHFYFLLQLLMNKEKQSPKIVQRDPIAFSSWIRHEQNSRRALRKSHQNKTSWNFCQSTKITFRTLSNNCCQFSFEGLKRKRNLWKRGDIERDPRTQRQKKILKRIPKAPHFAKDSNSYSF